MKHLLIFTVLVCAPLFNGCTTAHRRAAEAGAAGTVAVRLTSLLGMEGSYRDARLCVDGRFVGNYEPDETALVLPAGSHVVVVEVPRVYSRRHLPNGATTVLCFALKGEERIEVLGAGSKQSLVFNSENLKAREIKDDDGH
jgi:hypothetical protein